jgi:heme-degrading monooxygenase HmoA
MIVVLFKTQLRADIDADEYQRTAERMYGLASKMPGFVSFKDYTSEDGESVAVVRFESEATLEAWRTHPEHVAVQRQARERFYDAYAVQVCQTVREYEWSR